MSTPSMASMAAIIFSEPGSTGRPATGRLVENVDGKIEQAAAVAAARPAITSVGS